MKPLHSYEEGNVIFKQKIYILNLKKLFKEPKLEEIEYLYLSLGIFIWDLKHTLHRRVINTSLIPRTVQNACLIHSIANK